MLCDCVGLFFLRHLYNRSTQTTPSTNENAWFCQRRGLWRKWWKIIHGCTQVTHLVETLEHISWNLYNFSWFLFLILLNKLYNNIHSGGQNVHSGRKLAHFFFRILLPVEINDKYQVCYHKETNEHFRTNDNHLPAEANQGSRGLYFWWSIRNAPF